ncbi:MAG: 30S ribosomal protein S16 [Deltaproteobacteria bacterium]|nr:30S ribosomal protein S16 [Deltaproteobacteria bacterium]
MAAVIRLSRHGKRNRPFYRVVVANQPKPRDGKFLEVLGTFDPLATEGGFTVKKERVQYWLGVGAKPSDTAAELLKRYQMS